MAKRAARKSEPEADGSLLGWLARLTDRLGALIDEQRAQWKVAEGLGHGIFIGESDVDLALSGLRELPATSDDIPVAALERLQSIFQLDDTEMAILVAAIAPAVDRRFGLLFGYLNDDPNRRALTIDLALRVVDLPTWDAVARFRVGPEGTLAQARLIAVDVEPDFLRRALTVPDRVVAHILGLEVVPPELVRAQEPLVGGIPAPDALLEALNAGAPFLYLRSPTPAAATIAIAAAADAVDARVLHLSLTDAIERGTLREWLPLALREGALQGFIPVLGPVRDGLLPGAFDDLAAACVPVVLYGARDWDVRLSTIMPVTVDVAPLTEAEQAAVWAMACQDVAPNIDPRDLAGLRSGGAEIGRALRRAVSTARVRGEAVDAGLIVEQARREHAPLLERLAARVVPTVGLDDVVLPAATRETVEAFVDRIRNRDRVREELKVRSRGAKGRGITGLFCGPSGTGKTFTAEAVCGALGIDLYIVNLPSVLSKYIGETEQNLERVFSTAEDVPGLLFFDEADALFGKRSDVSDARDRYANIEVAYLLQRLERFDGIVVLATNLRANLDDAFNRRLDAVIGFPEPGEEERMRLWEAHLPPTVPRSKKLDLAFAARQFQLSGGSISSAARGAAHEVLRFDRPLDDGMIAHAIAIELDKAGRLVQADDFGSWVEHVGGLAESRGSGRPRRMAKLEL